MAKQLISLVSPDFFASSKVNNLKRVYTHVFYKNLLVHAFYTEV